MYNTCQEKPKSGLGLLLLELGLVQLPNLNPKIKYQIDIGIVLPIIIIIIIGQRVNFIKF